MSKLARDVTGQLVPALAFGTTLVRAFTGTSAQTAAIADEVYVVRLVATADVFVAIGADPTATTSSAYLPAGVVEYVAVRPGQKVAALQASAAGTLYVTQTA